MEKSTMLLLSVVFTICVSLAAGSSQKQPFRSKRATKSIIENYEVVSPEIVHEDEDVDKPHPRTIHVAVSSKLANVTLILGMNEELLPQGFTSRFYDESGREVHSKGHVNCFYQGWVEGHPQWRAVMSTCHGFRGEFGDREDSNNYFHLEPLSTKDNSLHQLHALYLHSEYKEVQGNCGSNHSHVINEELKFAHPESVRLRRQSSSNPTRYVELIAVNDLQQYNNMDSNLSRTVMRALEITNGMDSIYRAEYNIRIVLIESITWTNRDMITVVSDPETLLNSFRDYRPQITTVHDSAMLLTGIDLNSNTVGIAFVRAMCSDRSSVGVTQDGGRSITSTVSTAAHELGHIFNMNHDGSTCTCPDPSGTCIMAASSGFPPPVRFSSCSTNDLNTGFSDFNLDICLLNMPTMSVGNPVCGNGIREGTEICDCGSQTECTDPCCNAATCQLATGAVCSAGPCCTSTCQFRSQGTVCRAALGECDITERCTGTSSECPIDDHLLDGTPCSSNTGYCYSGSCPSYDQQCSVAFNSGNAESICYTNLNMRGDQFGNCGHTQTDFVACVSSDTQCGQLQCSSGQFALSLAVSTFTFTFRTSSGDIICRSFTTQPGGDTISPGLVQDGTKCGTDLVCLGQRCTSVDGITSLSCPVGSNGQICSGSTNGVCNNRGLCSCNTGFSGPTCNPIGDINECLTNNGGCDHTCTNTDGSFTCSCRSGFVLASNERDCNDINECSSSNGGCAQTCTNTMGSFECSCRSGYTLASNRRGCNDINECSSSNGGCAQTCTNTMGSFECSCRSGYTLASNRRGCNDINECSSSNGGCAQTCTNTMGSFECSCRSGYTLASNRRGCNDINECSSSNGGCAQTCTNTMGSFECSCRSGYTLASNRRGCNDINECLSSNGGCAQTCTNTMGSFECSCRSGYTLASNRRGCNDINECSSSNGGCAETCTNTIGSFDCSCRSGFVLANDGRQCNDVNECSTNNGGCQQVCADTQGSFVCSCESGYVLGIDGRSCNDINECSTSNGGCNQICSNNIGSFTCQCQQGYQLAANERTCNDINECNIRNGGCDQTCTNSDGSFDCSCMTGFSLLSDGQTCMSDNPCNASEANCEHFCTSSSVDSSFSCSCRTGYMLDSDGFTCNDINECSNGNSGCAETCTNIIGSFQCSCPPQSQLASDQLSCEGVNVTAPGDGGGNTGATIGGAVGGAIGAIVLVVLVILIIVVVVVVTKRKTTKPFTKPPGNDNLRKVNSRTPIQPINSPSSVTDEESAFGDSFEDVHYVQPPNSFGSPKSSPPTYQPPAPRPSYNYENGRKPAPKKPPARKAPPAPTPQTTPITVAVPPSKPLKPVTPASSTNSHVVAHPIKPVKPVLPHKPPPKPTANFIAPKAPISNPALKSHPPKPSAPPKPRVPVEQTHASTGVIKPAPPLKRKPALPPPKPAMKPDIQAKPVAAPRPATKPTPAQRPKMKWPPPTNSDQSTNPPSTAPKSSVKKPMVPPRK